MSRWEGHLAGETVSIYRQHKMRDVSAADLYSSSTAWQRGAQLHQVW
jgi:hypothetical protein